MFAAYITGTGDPSVIQYGDLPKPTPGLGEVLIKVGAVSVNPIDTYIRSGAITMALNFPYILGCDVAGTIESVGRKVRRFKAGDRVWASNQGLFGRQGTFAEYACVDEKWLYPTPPTESDAQAAAGALVGITAYLGLFKFARVQSAELVFVNGGAGGVGSAVIQQAKAAGAMVIATAGNEAKRAYCQTLGADVVLDYRSPNLDEEIRHFASAHGGINVWFETQRDPTLERTIDMMSQRGRIILMAGRQARPDFPLGAFYTKDLSILGFAMFNATPDEQRECAVSLNALFTQGGWHPAVGATMPMSQAAFAHQLQHDNTVMKAGTLAGKIVLVPGA
jgi:NADPH:quinone reductase